MKNSPYIRIYHHRRGKYEVEINHDYGSTMATSDIKSTIRQCEKYIIKRLETLDLDDVHSTFELITLGRKMPEAGNKRIEERVKKYNKKITNHYSSRNPNN